MHISQQPYRDLYAGLMESDKPAVSLLEPWLRRNVRELDWLNELRMTSSPDVPAGVEQLWRLYALSRVLQRLALRLQTGTADGSDWLGPEISVSEWSRFAEQLGLTIVRPQAFSPFDCEIIRARNGTDEHQPLTITTVRWPCLMLGNMLVCRAGVAVEGGTRIIDARVAASSTLYWAVRRKHRPASDLSHGWGSNSQWRTSFRRDFHVGDQRLYNADGRYDLGAVTLAGPDEFDDANADYPLNRQERIVLLTYRSLLKTARGDDLPWPYRDLWPYDDRLLTDHCGPRSACDNVAEPEA